MTTIKDVAAAAGVSVKTVSRVLNGRETVRSYLRERIERAVADLAYQPNLAARQLSRQRSFVIGMIVPRAGVGYIPRFVVALSSVCRDFGFQLVTEAVDHGELHQPFRQDGRFALTPDAVVLAPRYADDPELLARFEQQRMPLVRLAGSDGLYGAVVHLDDRSPAAEIVRHLSGLGHSRIGFVSMPRNNRVARERHDGYLDGLAAAGLTIDPALIATADFTYASGADAAATLLSLPRPPTAIFAGSDTLAAGVQAQVQRMDLRIPDEVAIAGFDDSPVARAMFPPLTSVTFPVRAVAEATARAAILGHADPLVVERHVIVRSSTNGDRRLCADPYADDLG